ncbi:MAG: cupin domain-containing protein [Kofleriaceae bacterium]
MRTSVRPVARTGTLVLSMLALAGCPAPTPAPTPPTSGNGSPAPPPADAREVTQEERLAAIQLAMNSLDEAVQSCWAAAAAAERFDIAGNLRALIDIGTPPGRTKATLVEDTVRNPRLAACVVTLLEAFTWAPPLHGQAIQLPFALSAPPDGQNVVDRTLVPWNGQGKVSIAVLLDDANSGNDTISLLELAVQSGGTTGMRVADRPELWYFLAPATIGAVGAEGKRVVAAGDMAFVAKGGAREILASAGDVHAVIAIVPGGKEGSARAGALPTRELTSIRAAPVGAMLFPAAKAKTFGPATIYVEPATLTTTPASAAILTLPAGAKVAEHVHANETEALYVLEGTGTMTVKGTALAVTPTSVVQIPPNTKHAFEATTSVRALQIYTPSGPEQRFKKKTP